MVVVEVEEVIPSSRGTRPTRIQQQVNLYLNVTQVVDEKLKYI